MMPISLHRDHACQACGKRQTPRIQCGFCGALGKIVSTDLPTVEGEASAKPLPAWLSRDPKTGRFLAGQSQRFPRAAPKRSYPTTYAPLVPVSSVEANAFDYQPSSIEAVDYVIGGGIVGSGVYLLGGLPGVGKSTLATQICDGTSRTGRRFALYCDGEENKIAVKVRCNRIGLSMHEDTFHVQETSSIDDVLAACRDVQPDLCVVNSLQTMSAHGVQSELGSPTQIHAVATRIYQWAHNQERTAFLVISHFTKDNDFRVASTIEHLVDCKVRLDADEMDESLICLSIDGKNRFGDKTLKSFFTMTTEHGLIDA